LEPFILWKGISPSLGLKKCEVGLHLSLSETKVLPFELVNNKLIFPIWKDPSITEPRYAQVHVFYRLHQLQKEKLALGFRKVAIFLTTKTLMLESSGWDF